MGYSANIPLEDRCELSIKLARPGSRVVWSDRHRCSGAAGIGPVDGDHAERQWRRRSHQDHHFQLVHRHAEGRDDRCMDAHERIGGTGGRGTWSSRRPWAQADAAGVAGVVPRRRLREPMHRHLIFHRTRMLLIRIVPPFDSVAAARAAAVATLLRLRPRLLWLRL